jgi:hypothetical protein
MMSAAFASVREKWKLGEVEARGEHRSFQFVALSAYDLENDGLRFGIPVPRVAVITDTDAQHHSAEYKTLVCPLLEGDFLGLIDETALFTKIASAAVVRI